jgi:hypothetical protein
MYVNCDLRNGISPSRLPTRTREVVQGVDAIFGVIPPLESPMVV